MRSVLGYQLSSAFALRLREKTENLTNELNCVCISSLQRAVDTLHLGYKNESFNDTVCN
jgi:hypothetical protein